MDLNDRPSRTLKSWGMFAFAIAGVLAIPTSIGVLLLVAGSKVPDVVLIGTCLGSIAMTLLYVSARWACKEDLRDAVKLSDADARDVLALLVMADAVDAFKAIVAEKGRPTYLTIDSMVELAVTRAQRKSEIRREDVGL